ncbi:hypothetical protein FHT76_008489 [Rhizobium sp. BK176]|nr:hypothetical protein [Rhizobium sp. BK176]
MVPSNQVGVSNPTLPENFDDRRFAARSLRRDLERAHERLRYRRPTPFGGTRPYDAPHHHVWIYFHPDTVERAQLILENPQAFFSRYKFPFVKEQDTKRITTIEDLDEWSNYSGKFFTMHGNNLKADFLTPIRKGNTQAGIEGAQHA